MTTSRRSTLACLVLGLALVPPAAGQEAESPRHTLALGLGLDHRALHDDHASPLRYTGTGIPVEVAYRYDGAPWHHRVDLSFRSATLTSSITEDGVPAEDLLSGRFRHTVLRDAGRWRGLTWRVGGSIQGEGEQRDHTYIGTLDETYVLALLGIGPAAEVAVPLSSRSAVEASLAVPVLALVLRSPYAVKGEYDIGLEPVGGFVRVLPRVAWRWRATERLGLELSLRGRYGRVDAPFERRTLDRSVVVSGEWSP